MVLFLNIVLLLLIPISEACASPDTKSPGVKRVKRHPHPHAIPHYGFSSRRGYFGFPLGEDVPPPLPQLPKLPSSTQDDTGFKFVACFDSWQNNSRGVPASSFDDSYQPQQCSDYCKDLGYQVSMLKGAECACKSFTGFKLNAVPNTHCQVPCPVSTLGSGTSPPSASESCGGNIHYSVYCSVGDHNCDELPLGGADGPGLKIANFLPKSSPVTFCGRCISGSSCMSGHISPAYDYFPKNEPWACRSFCNKKKDYAISSGVGQDGNPILVEQVRYPTKHVALSWDGRFNSSSPPLPICACIDDVSKFQQVDDQLCSAPCPGEPGEKCGRKDADPDNVGAFYASIHCTWGDCSDPPTTTQATTTTITTTQEPTSTTTPPPPPETTTLTSTISTTPKEQDSTTTNIITTSTSTQKTTLNPGDCTEDTNSEGCPTTTTEKQEETSRTTVSSMSTSTSSTPIVTTTPKLTTTTPHEDVNINCAVMCSGTEYSGRFWTVCAGGRENMSCNTAHSRGVAIWECSDAGEWVTSQPDYSGCSSTWLDDSDDASGRVNDTASALKYLHELNEHLSNNGDTANYFGHEISTLTTILDRVTEAASTSTLDATEFGPVAEKTVGLTRILITAPAPWHQLSAQNRSTVSTSLIQTVEDASLLLAFKMPDTSRIHDPSHHDETPLSLSSDYFVVAGSISKQSGGGINNSLNFPSDEFANQEEGSSLLKLPPGWQNLVKGQSIQYVGLLLRPDYANLLLPGQFPVLGIDTNSRERVVLNGNLMSFTIAAGTDKGRNLVRVKKDLEKSRIDFKRLGKGVEITFHHDLEAWGDSRHDLRRRLHGGESPKAVLGSGRCSFWDTDQLIWSQKGCKTLKSSRLETICECDHLTSFAVLMDVHNYFGKDLGLEILTMLLCSISFLCLLLSVLIFSSYHGIQSERNSITKNLSICLLIGNTLVLLVLDRNYFNMTEGLCVASGILTHYVFLAAFAWMGVEGLHLYRMVVHVFDSENNPLNMYRVMSYGVPLIVVILTTMIGYLKGDRPYGGDVVCWMNGGYIWSFLVPVLLIVVENLIILFIALKTAYQVQYSSQKKVPAFQNKMRSFRIWLRGCLSLTILLGVTWLLGFFTLVPATPGLVAAYLFTILNASQGIFIFIFHCVYNDKVRQVTYQRFGNYLPSWITSSLQSSSSCSTDPSEGSKRGNSRGMKHSSSDSSLNNKRTPKNISINQARNKSKLSPASHFPDENEDNFGEMLPGGISIIGRGEDAVPQVVNRRGSLILRQQWDSFGTVSSVDSVRIGDRNGGGGGSLSDSSSSYMGGNSTDNSERAMIR